MTRALLVLTLIATGAAAQTPEQAVVTAEARLVQGDTLEALRIVRAVQERGPNTAGLERIRLVAERTGTGLRRYPPPARRRLIARTARRLLSLDPQSPLALETLADDAVATVLFCARPRRPPRPQPDFDPDRANVRLRGSRFDIAERARAEPMLDRTGPGRDAARSAYALLDTLLAVDPARAAPFLIALASADENWARLDSVSDRLPASSLAQGLAAWRLGRTADAERAFDAGLAALSETERARLESVAALLPPDSLAALQADPAGVARRFWAREDPRRITPQRERRLEHLARAVEADALFGRPLGALFSDRPRRGIETDRGRIWLRYGRPTREAGFTPSGNVPAYDRDDLAAFVVWEYDGLDGGTRFVFDDATRNGRYRTYSPPASAYATPTGRASSDDYVTEDRRLQRDAPELFADTTATALPFMVARFRDEDGSTDAIAAFPVDAGASAALFLGSTRVGQTGATVVRISQDSALRAETLGPGGFARAEANVEPLSRSGFGISDLLLTGSSGPSVVRRGDALVPLAADTLARGASVSVYAEVYGLTLPGGRSDAEAEVRLVPIDTRSGVGRTVGRLFGRGRPRGVSTAIEISGSTETDAVALTLDARALAPGPYRLVLRITDRAAGASAETARNVVLRE